MLGLGLGLSEAAIGGSSGAADPSAGYALYMPFAAPTPTYRVGNSTYSTLASMPGYNSTRSGAKGELGAAGAVLTYGPELITNGDGNSITGWTAGSDATLSTTGGRLRVTANTGGGGATADQSISLAIGAGYRFTTTMWASASGMARIQDAGGNFSIQGITGNGPQTVDITFRATANFDPFLGAASAGAWAGAGQYAEFDNISFKRIVNNAVIGFATTEPGVVPGVGYWSRKALTNLLTFSQDFGSWTDGGATCATDNIVAPDGTTTADTITATGSVAARASASATVSSGQVYTASVFVPAGGTSQFAVIVVSEGANAAFMTFNRTTGAIGASQTLAGTLLLTGYAVSIGSGWRFIVTYTAGTTSATVYVGLSETANARASSAGKTMPAWQGQLIAGNHPQGGPIIPTAAATAAIGADGLEGNWNTILTDQDFFVWSTANLIAPVDATSNELFLRFGGLFWLGRDSFGRLAVSDALAPTGSAQNVDVILQTTGRVAIGLRRRSGNCTFIVKRTDGSVVRYAEQAVAWPGAIANVRIGTYAMGDFNPNNPIEGVYSKVGTFSDAAIDAIMAAA